MINDLLIVFAVVGVACAVATAGVLLFCGACYLHDLASRRRSRRRSSTASSSRTRSGAGAPPALAPDELAHSNGHLAGAVRSYGGTE